MDYFKYLHYGKRNKHKNFVLEKMNIGHFYQIKDLFRYIPPKPLVSNRHYDIWIMKWCFLFENVHLELSTPKHENTTRENL